MQPTSDEPTIPGIGLGTWKNTNPDQCAESVRVALEAGYRHIDTAQIYDNEAAIGAGIERASVDRDDIFLATKVWIDNLAHDDVLETTQASLDRLGVEYVDLLYIHWPARTYDPESTLPAFDQLYDEGLIRGVGVSNFEPSHVKTADDVLDAPILANQVECHPLLPQRDLRTCADKYGHELVAYSPLARGELLDHPTMREIASEVAATPAQVAIAWLQVKGTVPIPKATSEGHIRENLSAADLELPATAIEQIDAIEERSRKVDPDFAPW